jgi:hypothetical protein
MTRGKHPAAPTTTAGRRPLGLPTLSHRHLVLGDLVVVRHQREPLAQRLSHEHPIEGIAMVRRQARSFPRVPEVVGELREPGGHDAVLHELGQPELPETDLETQFPRRGRAHVDNIRLSDRAQHRNREARVGGLPPEEDVAVEQEPHTGLSPPSMSAAIVASASSKSAATQTDSPSRLADGRAPRPTQPVERLAFRFARSRSPRPPPHVGPTRRGGSWRRRCSRGSCPEDGFADQAGQSCAVQDEPGLRSLQAVLTEYPPRPRTLTP